MTSQPEVELTLTVNPFTVPNELQRLSFWLLWAPTPHADPNNPKILKKPVKGKDWQNSLSSFDDLVSRVATSKRFGLGFAYTQSHPYICIDIDSQSEENMALASSLNSYTEVSPSGKGFHIIVSTDNKQSVEALYGTGCRNTTCKRDLFISTGFVTFTNDTLDSPPPPIRTIPADELSHLLKPYFNQRFPDTTQSTQAEPQPTEQQQSEQQQPKFPKVHKPANAKYVRSLLDKIPVRCLTSDIFARLSADKPAQLDLNSTEEAREPWLIIGQALHHEYQGGVAGYRLWLNWSLQGNKFSAEALDATWESFSSLATNPITLGTIIALAEAQAPSYPDVDEKGKLLGTLNNFNCFLRAHSITASTNELTKQSTIDVPSATKAAWGIFAPDFSLAELSAVMIGEIGKMPMSTGTRSFNARSIMSYLKIVANGTFINPIKDYFQACGETWDGKSRLPELMRTIEVSPHFEKYRPSYDRFVRKWLIQVAAAACSPKENPARLSRVLVLSGNQGIGKTMWVQSLFPQKLKSYCQDKEIKIGKFKTETTKLAMELSTTLICNINEIDRVLRTDQASDFKAFLDQTTDHIVLPYGDSPTEMVRRTVFIGSTNSTAFLTDATGNRRFELIHAKSLDYSHFIDVDQLWGEIYHYYNQGEKWWLEFDNQLDALAIRDRDEINALAYKFPHETFAAELTDMFDSDQPRSEWIQLTLKDIRALLGFTNTSGNDRVSRNIKTTLIAWLIQLGQSPEPVKGTGDRARVYYNMPPLRESSNVPTNAFTAKETIN